MKRGHVIICITKPIVDEIMVQHVFEGFGRCQGWYGKAFAACNAQWQLQQAWQNCYPCGRSKMRRLRLR